MLNIRQNTSRIVTKLFRRFGLLWEPLSVNNIEHTHIWLTHPAPTGAKNDIDPLHANCTGDVAPAINLHKDLICTCS